MCKEDFSKLLGRVDVEPAPSEFENALTYPLQFDREALRKAIQDAGINANACSLHSIEYWSQGKIDLRVHLRHTGSFSF